MNEDNNIFKNTIYFGDNLDIMKKIINERRKNDLPVEFIDLIYIDPPFNSKRVYNVIHEDDSDEKSQAQKFAFNDTWSTISYLETIEEIENLDNGKWINIANYLNFLKDTMNIEKPIISYLSTMAIRIIYMRKMLKKTGSFYLHCDIVMDYQLRQVLDFIFDKDNFRNSIVWCYRKWTNSAKNFQKNTDTILFYSKSKDYTFNFIGDENAVSKHYEKGYHDNTYEEDGKRIKQLIVYDESKAKTKIDSGKYDKVVYRIDKTKPNLPNWWEIQILNSQSKERLGYPTQKPLALMDRIIKASSNEGDLIADFFCGCGTTIHSAVKNNRNFLGCDIGIRSISLIQKRVSEDKSIKDKIEFKIDGLPLDDYTLDEYFRNPESVVNKNATNKVSHARRLEFEEYVIEYLLQGITNEKKSSQGQEHDGFVAFEHNRQKYVCYIECKSGAVTLDSVSRFINDIKTMRQKRPNIIGLFVCFKYKYQSSENIITSGFINLFREVGYIDDDKKIPICEIMSVNDMLLWKKGGIASPPKFLSVGLNTTYRTSSRDSDAKQGELL